MFEADLDLIPGNLGMFEKSAKRFQGYLREISSAAVPKSILEPPKVVGGINHPNTLSEAALGSLIGPILWKPYGF